MGIKRRRSSVQGHGQGRPGSNSISGRQGTAKPGRRAGFIRPASGTVPPIHLLKAPQWSSVSGAAPGPTGTFRGVGARRQSRRGLKRFAFLLLLIALVGGGLGWATHSPYFKIRVMQVQGNVLLPASAILQAASIRPGSNLWLVSSRLVRKRLSAALGVDDVHLVRKFPHTLTIVVRERQPWAVVRAGGRIFLVDRDQKVVFAARQLPLGLAARLPVVILAAPIPGDIPPPGGAITHRPLTAALSCLRVSEDPRYGAAIDRVFIDGRRNICLNVNGLARVMFGQPTNLGPKLSMLRTLVRGSPALMKQAQAIDLQNPEAPAYIPRPEPHPAAQVSGNVILTSG